MLTLATGGHILLGLGVPIWLALTLQRRWHVAGGLWVAGALVGLVVQIITLLLRIPLDGPFVSPLVAGEVHYPEEPDADPDEGSVLLCCSVPKTDVTIDV